MGDFSIVGGSAEVKEAGFDYAATYGQSVTSGASNTLGTRVELLTAANNTYDSDWVNVCIQSGADGGQQTFLVTILLGGSGVEIPIMQNLFAGGSGSSALHIPSNFQFPLKIPSGERITAECQASGTSDVCFVNLIRNRASFRSGSGLGGVLTLGAQTSTSSGILIPAGAANAFGSPGEITSSLAHDIRGFVVSCLGRTSASWDNHAMTFNVMVGANPDETTIYEGYTFSTQSNESMSDGVSPFIPVGIAAGERVTIKVQADSGDSDADLDYVFYGVR